MRQQAATKSAIHALSPPSQQQQQQQLVPQQQLLLQQPPPSSLQPPPPPPSPRRSPSLPQPQQALRPQAAASTTTTLAPSGPAIVTTLPEGAGPRGGVWAPVTELQGDDWLVYLRIQKTGSQTFWQTLQQSFRGGALWGRRGGSCQKGLFCGHRCLEVAKQQLREIQASHGIGKARGGGGGSGGRGRGRGGGGEKQCRLVFRGHIGYWDYEEAFRALAPSWGAVASSPSSSPPSSHSSPRPPLLPPQQPRVLFLAFFREPVARALSEYKHVTEGLVAQFGPHTFGAAWDYNFSFTGRRDDLERKRREGSFGAWLACEACRVGSSNRMTRFLGAAATTGTAPPAPGGAVPAYSDNSDAAMLARAKERLDRCAFIGLMERSVLIRPSVLIRSFVPSFLRSFIHPFMHLFIHPFIRSFVRSFVRSTFSVSTSAVSSALPIMLTGTQTPC